MKTFEQFLGEGISNIVYHFTPIHSAVKILKTDRFDLTSPVGSDKMLKGKKSQQFYLSTTRSKHGRYTQSNSQGVVLELNGRKLANNYSGQPIDYWGREFRLAEPKFNEMEDRIFSDKPTIQHAKKYIKAIHVLLPVRQAKEPSPIGKMMGKAGTPKGTVKADVDNQTKTQIVALWVQSKKSNIPVYFYDTLSAWMNQRKPMDLKVAELALKDKKQRTIPPEGPLYGRADRKSSLHTWLELIFKPVNARLTTKPFGGAIRQLRILFSQFDTLASFNADFSNEKTTKDAAKIILFMRKNKMKEFSDLIDWLRIKWKSKK